LYVLLDALTIVDVVGSDAVAILNNLCTADIKRLQVGLGVEGFVTEVRGRTVGHVCLYLHDDRLRLIGAPDQTERLIAHIDRYIIREQAQPEDQASSWTAYLVSGENARRLADAWKLSPGESPHLSFTAAPDPLADTLVYQVPWTGPAVWLCLTPTESPTDLEAAFASLSLTRGTLSDFHAQRVLAGYPWFGSDVDESNLPQEADRNEEAISFTKGCYLGQETVARLDALGQVQKKLVHWQIDTTAPIVPGTELLSGDKKVGKITSTALFGDHTLAIGYARRSHFDPGSTADCDGHQAMVVQR